MASYEKARVNLTIKHDMAFSFTLTSMLDQILVLRGQPRQMTATQLGRFLRVVPHTRLVIHAIEKFIRDAKVAVQENRINVFPVFKEDMKGGVIQVDMEGSPEEIAEWTKVGLKDKVVLRGAKRWLEVEIQK